MLYSKAIRYLPFIGEVRMLSMGLNPLGDGHWIEPDPGLPEYHANKLQQRSLLGDRVYAELPESLPAQQELKQLLLAHLLDRHGDVYHREGDHLQAMGMQMAMSGEEPLWIASLWIQDDICLLQPGENGYRLTAASLAAPSHWRLEEKIGRALDVIHAPIPDFKEQLGSQVARFFDFLKVETPVWRCNWSVLADSALMQRGESEQRPVAGPLYMRVERQCLRRLPDTGAVVFTIRVYVHPLEVIQGVSGASEALQQAVKGLDKQHSRYKGIRQLQPMLDDTLAEWVAAEGR